MNAYQKRAQLKRNLGWICLVAALLGLAGFGALQTPQAARADGGGWPTATWTPLPTWTPTITQQAGGSGGILFPPTLTFTPGAAGFLVEPVDPGILAEATQVTLATQAAPRRSLLSVLLWPLIIVGILGIFLLVVLLRNRIVVNA